MNNLKNNFFIFFALIFCGFLSFAQGTFFLDSNGVTVKCTGCVNGDTGIVGGQTYTAYSTASLALKSKSDADWNRVVTSLVTDTSDLFKATTFDEDISSWDTSNVTDMSGMFHGVSVFNQDIGRWDVSKVTNMSYMFGSSDSGFNGVVAFNQDLGDWDVGRVTNFRGMFRRNFVFNQDISDWNMISATSVQQMFDRATSFSNGGVSLNCWDTSNITNFNAMFFAATSFNQDISNWCVQLQGGLEPTGWAGSNPTFAGNAAFQPSWGASCIGNSVVISFSDVTRTFGDPNFTVTASSNQSGIPITYSIADTSIATINASSGQITILKSGTTTVTASQDDGSCISGSKNMTLTINQQSVNIDADNIVLTYGDPAFTLTASSLVTDRGFTFTISDGTIGSISGNVLSVLKVGTTNITVSQAANDFYAPVSKVITLTVNKQSVNINANDIVLTYGDPAFTLTASSLVTDRGFTFTISDATIGSISGNVLSVLRPGTTNITISQASNDLYSPLSKVISLTVNKATPTLDFPEITKTYGDSDFTPTVTTNSSGNITFSVSDPSIASSLGSSLSIVGAGQTNVTVNIDETENYFSISGSTTMTVNKGTPTIIFNDITKEIDDPDFNINPTSDSSGLMSFSIADSSIASISGNTISILRRGTTTVTVNQSETSLFNSGSATMILTVNGASFDISWYESRIRKAFSIGQYELKEPTYTSDYDGEIRYVSSNLSIGNFTGKTLNFNKIGRVLLSARFEGSDYYQDAVIQVEFDILKDNQVIIPSELPNETPLRDFISIPIPLSATSTSGAPVYIKVEEGSAANLSGTLGNYELITNSQTGIVSITYFTVENDHPNYYPAALHFSLDVVKLNQNITFNPEPALEVPYSENLEISINAISDSNLDVSVNKLNVSNNVLENNTLSINDLGQVYINAEQEGNQFYNPTTANRVITIIPAPTELSDFSIPEKFIYDDDFEITPPTSSRDGEIIYTSDNPEVAVVSGTTIFIIGIGTCNITAYMESIDFYTSSSISSEFVIKPRDTDQDSVPDEIDNCPDVANPSQLDDDMDGIGNECDPDSNGDGIKDDLISVSQLLTPGTSGSESRWQVQNIEFFPNSIVYVYNRNGQLVFQKNSYQNDWNGTYQKTGSFLPAGPYYFVVEISDTNEIKKGWLYINY
ncbi:MAG: BspA family leucine-rich repeat surface protein [Flavobacteriaceae bacterium]|nr:BspA family leucine-rich repeat surface protein [Flavobacteriaceae bacterium]